MRRLTKVFKLTVGLALVTFICINHYLSNLSISTRLEAERSCTCSELGGIAFHGVSPPHTVLRLNDSLTRRGSTLHTDSRSRLVSPTHTVSARVPSNNSKPRECYKHIQIFTDKFTWTLPNVKYQRCPGLECGIHMNETTSYEAMKTSDAVILFHETRWIWQELLPHKRPGQKWVFVSHESPINTKRGILPLPSHHNTTYDYIMSYRRHEGGLFGDFGRFIRDGPGATQPQAQNWTAGKTGKPVAWIAKNCVSNFLHWNRTGFVRELAKRVGVDMYGACGDLECPRRSKLCDTIMHRHKFYLALENSQCRNYITEKFWLQSLSKGLVPIVYGPPKEDYELIAPPNSFIHVQDFKSISDLADYIKYLDGNDEAYNAYLEWRKIGRVEMAMEHQLFKLPSLCNILVRRMLEDERAVRAGTYRPMPTPNWNTWWTGSCQKPPAFPIALD